MKDDFKKNISFFSCLCISIIVALCTTINATGLISTTFLNIVLSTCVGAIFLVNAFVYHKTKILSLILIIIDVCIVTINGSFEMISLSIIVMMMDVFSYNLSIDFRKILKVFLIIMLAIFSMITMLYTLFNFNNHDVVMWRIDKIIYRKSLGFLQPNTVSILVISIFFSYLGLIGEKFVKFKVLVILIISMSIFYYTQSRTSMYVLLYVGSVVFLLGKNTNKFSSHLWVRLTFLIPFLMTILSVYVLLSPLNVYIDNLLSGRVVLYKEFFDNYGIGLLGNDQLENSMFDNGYLQSLLSKGGLFFIEQLIIIVGLFSANKKYRCTTLLVLSGYYLLGFTETVLQHFELILPIIILLTMDIKKSKEEML